MQIDDKRHQTDLDGQASSPYLPLDHIEPLAATLGVMLYPGDSQTERRKAYAYTSQFLVVPVQQFLKEGGTINTDELSQLYFGTDETLSDIQDRWRWGLATGEIFKMYFALSKSNPDLASWNNAISIIQRFAGRHRIRAGRSQLWNTRRRFLRVSHLWGAFSIRGRRFEQDQSVGYDALDNFLSFVTEAEILRQWGQTWQHKRRKAKPPLPTNVWRPTEGWLPPKRKTGWPETGKIPHIIPPKDVLGELKPAGRPKLPR